MKKSTKIIIFSITILVIIGIVIVSTLTSKNTTTNSVNTITTNNTTNGTTNGTGTAEDNNNYIDITYENTSKVYNIEGSEHTITVNQEFPTVRANDTKVQNVLQEELGKIANDEFNEYKSKVEERLSNYTASVMNNLGDLSVSWKFTNSRNDNKVVSVQNVSSGSLASVSWDTKRGYSFDATTGERLTIDKVANHKEALRKYINETTIKYLRLNAQKLGIQSVKVNDLENLINIDKLNWYFSRAGLTICFEKNYLSLESFEYTIPYYNLEGLIKPEYL